jgi:hypothetical protein
MSLVPRIEDQYTDDADHRHRNIFSIKMGENQDDLDY